MTLQPDPILSEQQRRVMQGLTPLTRGRDTRPSASITPRGQAKVRKALAVIERFRPVPAAEAIAPLLPISDDAVLDWVAADLEARRHLSWSLAKALAYLDTFSR